MREKKKFDPRVWMGICSAVGYAAVVGVKAYAFGWEDVPAFWIWAGAVGVALMIGAGVYFRSRDRRALREAVERSAGRARRSGAEGVERASEEQ